MICNYHNYLQINNQNKKNFFLYLKGHSFVIDCHIIKLDRQYTKTKKKKKEVNDNK